MPEMSAASLFGGESTVPDLSQQGAPPAPAPAPTAASAPNPAPAAPTPATAGTVLDPVDGKGMTVGVSDNTAPGTTPGTTEVTSTVPAEIGESAEEGTEGEEFDPIAFFGKVNEMWGREVAVEYGDIDPSGAEGIFRREKTIHGMGQADLLNEIKDSDPRAYAYLQHRRLGGDDESFFENKGALELPAKDSVVSDAIVQERVYRQLLRHRGTDASDADTLVAAAKTTNTLSAKGLSAYDVLNTELQKEVKAYDDEIAANRVQTETDTKGYYAAVDKLISTGATDRFIIPQDKKNEFKSFVNENIVYDQAQRKFYLSNEIDLSKMGSVLDALYFMYNKGDLSALIAREANTLLAKKSQMTLGAANRAKTPKTGGQQDALPTGSTKALKDLF